MAARAPSGSTTLESHRHPLDLAGFKGHDEALHLTAFERGGLVLRCDIFAEDSLVPLARAFMSEDEAQRLFSALDVRNVGYFTCEDVQRYGLPDARGFYDRFTHYNNRVNFNDFKAKLAQICDAQGHLGLADRLNLIMCESSASMLSRFVTVFVMIVILCSTLSFIVETMPISQSQSCSTCEPEPNACARCPPKLDSYQTSGHLWSARTFWLLCAILASILPSPSGFYEFEKACIIVFTIEYLTRVLTTPFTTFKENIKVEIDLATVSRIDSEQSPSQRLLRYMLLPMNLIDLFAILPFYIELALGRGGGLGFLRVLRLTRVFRIFKMGKYSTGATLLGRTLLRSLPALQLLVFFSLIGLTVFASIMYFVELGTWTVNEDYPHGMYLTDPNFDDKHKEFQQPSTFTNIPRCFWFVLVTATTVGYGDMVPVSDLGKVIGAITMVAGLLVIALPITVLGSNFSQEYQRLQEETERDVVEKELRTMHRSALVESGWRQQGISPLVKSVGRSMEARLEKAATWCAPLLCCRGATDDQPPEEPEMEAAASLARIRSQQSQGRLSSSESARENRDSGDALFATPGSGPPDRLASLEGRRPMPTTHQENVHANPNAALQWVAVMNAYYELAFCSTPQRLCLPTATYSNLYPYWCLRVLRDQQVTTMVLQYRNEARLSKVAAEVLMDEAYGMVAVATTSKRHFIDVMPSLTTVTSWVTRNYQNDRAVLDRRRGMVLIKKYIDFAQILCSANMQNCAEDTTSDLVENQLPPKVTLDTPHCEFAEDARERKAPLSAYASENPALEDQTLNCKDPTLAEGSHREMSSKVTFELHPVPNHS